MRFTPQLRALSWLVEKPIAHRGLHTAEKGILENTESAFAAALANNYAIECDLQLTQDGEAVVFHDETSDRLMEQPGLIIQRSTSEIQALKFKACKDRIQTLAELLEQVNGKVTLVIELKSHWDGNTALARRAVEVLQHYKGAFALMSFDPALIAAVATMAPHMVRGITADRAVDPYYNVLPLAQRLNLRNFLHLKATRPDFVSYYFRDLPFEPISALREAGLPIITWTIRSAAEAAIARRYSDQITFEGFSA